MERQFTLSQLTPSGAVPILRMRVDGNRTVAVAYPTQQFADFAHDLLERGVASAAGQRNIAYTEGTVFIEALREQMARSTYWSLDETEPSPAPPRREMGG
jgi:hypothetical protein